MIRNQVFYGNDIDIAKGESKIGSDPVDSLNNVEMVLLSKPDVGEYTIEVIGTTVNGEIETQGYALVATGDSAKLGPPFKL